MTVMLQSAATIASAAPKVSAFSLENGLEVVVIPDHRAPVVTHMVWYKVGAADEPRGISGIAHFLEHLMFKGTEKIAPGEYSKIIARNGGQDNAFTSQDTTAYHQRVAKDRLELVMSMEADRMRNLKLLEKDVLTEREVILEERRSRVDNSPSSILSEQMTAALYLAHPYGIPVIGWENEMRKLSRDDATKFYSRYYAPNNAILVVAGDVTADEVRVLAEKTYGKVKPVDNVARAPRPVEPKPQAARRVHLEDARAGQATVQRFYLAPSETKAKPFEAEALDLLMQIVGSGTTSRLYRALVVKQKIASSAGAWYSGSGLDSGRIGVYGVSSGKNTIETVEKAIDAVLEEVRSNGVTQRELDRARNGYMADYIYANDNQVSLARRYGWAKVMGRSIDYVQELPARLEKVTVDQVNAVAQKYLLLKRSVTGVLKPLAKKAADVSPSPAKSKNSG